MMNQEQKNALDKYLTASPPETPDNLVIVNHTEYQYDVEGDHITLSVDGKPVLFLEYGYKDLMNLAHQATGHWRQDTLDDNDGETFESDNDAAEQYAEDKICDYIEKEFLNFKMIEE